MAHFWTCKAFLPAMIQHKQGHIVTVASAAGLTVAPGMVAYGSSKHAAVGFGHGLRKELKTMGHEYVGTSLVCPAHIETPLFKGFKQPMQWLIPTLQPGDVAQTIVSSVMKKKQYVVMPTMADPSFQQFALPVWLQDKLESLAGLNNMMKHMDMAHSETVVQGVAAKARL